MRSAALLNFVAGTSAAIFAALLAAIPAGREHGVAAVSLAISAAPWLSVAILLATAASHIETARQRMDRDYIPQLRASEIADLQRRFDEEVRQPVRRYVTGAIASAVLGVVLLILLYQPGLLDRLFDQ